MLYKNAASSVTNYGHVYLYFKLFGKDRAVQSVQFFLASCRNKCRHFKKNLTKLMTLCVFKDLRHASVAALDLECL